MSTRYNDRLGICIPTYKRPDQLLRCVHSIIAAAEPYNVPVILADDSADETNTQAVAQLTRRYPHIIHHKNERNLGIDRNILHAIDLCPCEYAWSFGEDDRMKPQAIQTVLAALADGPSPPALVVPNYSMVNEDISLVIKERYVPLTADMRLPAAQFFRQLGWSVNFIGGCIINTALWSQVDSAKYVGTYFAYSGTILEAIRDHEVQMIAEPLVLQRSSSYHDKTWLDQTHAVFAGWEKLTGMLHSVYGEEACTSISADWYRMLGYNSFKMLCGQRSVSLYNLDDYRSRIRPLDRSRIYKLGAWLIAVGPPRIFQGLRRLWVWRRDLLSRRIAGYE